MFDDPEAATNLADEFVRASVTHDAMRVWISDYRNYKAVLDDLRAVKTVRASNAVINGLARLLPR